MEKAIKFGFLKIRQIDTFKATSIKTPGIFLGRNCHRKILFTCGEKWMKHLEKLEKSCIIIK